MVWHPLGRVDRDAKDGSGVPIAGKRSPHKSYL